MTFILLDIYLNWRIFSVLIIQTHNMCWIPLWTYLCIFLLGVKKEDGNRSFKIFILSSRYQNTNVNKLFHHEKTLWTNNSDEVDRSWKSDICLANKRLIDTKWPKRCRIVTIAIYFSGESHKKQLMFLRL